MYIGEVSKRTNLSVKAIRFYEEKGLIIAPARKGVYRVYTQEHVELLNLIAEAKALGVTLAEIGSVINYQNGKINWSDINAFLMTLKRRLTTEMHDIALKIAKVDACISSIKSGQQIA